MRVLFTVFSASGNTAKVCGLFAERLKERGAECESVTIRISISAPDTATADTLVIGYPVHGFNAPQMSWTLQKTCQNAIKRVIIL